MSIFKLLSKQEEDKGKEEEKGKTVLIYDFRRKIVKLPNGEVIPSEDIINIDTVNRTITYYDKERNIRTVKYEYEEKG